MPWFLLSTASTPKTIAEVLSHPRWWQVMMDKKTCNLVPLPPGISVVGRHWIFTIVGPDEQEYQLKACLVAKCYTQIS